MPASPLVAPVAHTRVSGRRLLLALLVFPFVLSATSASADVPAGVDPRVCAVADGVMPANVTVHEPFPALIRDMLMHSPTFRAQCRRVAEAGNLRVVLRLDMGPRPRNRTARAVFTFTDTGELLARIDLYLNTNFAPIVAHEFEHVIEQLDQLDLPGLAKARGDVHEVEPGVYETDRADTVESIVEREMFGRKRSTRGAAPGVTTPAPARAPVKRSIAP